MRASLNYYKADHSGLDRTSQSVFTALGRGEVAMTKGLAAVLAGDPKLAVDLALSSPLRSAVEQLGITEEALRATTDLTVDSEERQTPGSGMRRDLVLRFLQDSHRVLTVIIEAKHTDFAASAAVVQQVENYLDVQGCLDRYGDRKVGLTLTKAEVVSARKDIASMTWTRVTEILIASGSAMGSQFAHHVRESMSLQHFEVEVYSVPAGHSSAAV